jgi:hypothetical protein
VPKLTNVSKIICTNGGDQFEDKLGLNERGKLKRVLKTGCSDVDWFYLAHDRV